MLKNMFHLTVYKHYSSDPNTGGKIIQLSDHKQKADQKRQKQNGINRGQGDSLARNLKNPHANRLGHSSQYKSFQKSKKKSKSNFSIFTICYYVFAALAILFGLYILFGGLFSGRK